MCLVCLVNCAVYCFIKHLFCSFSAYFCILYNLVFQPISGLSLKSHLVSIIGNFLGYDPCSCFTVAEKLVTLIFSASLCEYRGRYLIKKGGGENMIDWDFRLGEME